MSRHSAGTAFDYTMISLQRDDLPPYYIMIETKDIVGFPDTAPPLDGVETLADLGRD